ncbi:co-chaperone GroES [Alphaproteobacteria bacterium endosymbiont of Tiliacea citrago]|uniref:co-chaperone GroES n=1 Tax=Alphaproteobacteria bacterium endosymbiont of Tiliacea citrago TaxID=3077944 RepID=UPI00313BC667
MGIRPLTGRILIKKIKTEKVGGLFIAEATKDKSSRGEVLAIGEFEKDKSFSVKVGDIAVFPSWSGTIVSAPASEDELIIIKAEEILGVEE